MTIGKDGLVDLIDIAPRALRAGSGALAELVREAVRDAQEDWFHQLAQAGADEDERVRSSGERLQKKLDEIDVVYAQRMQELHRIVDGISGSQ